MNPTAWDRALAPSAAAPRNRADRRRAQQAANRTARQKTRARVRIMRAMSAFEKEPAA